MIESDRINFHKIASTIMYDRFRWLDFIEISDLCRWMGYVNFYAAFLELGDCCF